MYITATGAFLPPNVPILMLVQSIPRIGHVRTTWAFPSTNGGQYLPTHCAMSLN